jgi:hypothetical protein
VELAMQVKEIKKYFADIDGFDFNSEKLGLGISQGGEMPLYLPF